MSDVSHPIFARIYGVVVKVQDRFGDDANRNRLLSGLSGRVVEVGCGPGTNFSHYPDSVKEVVAVEPDATMRSQANIAAAKASLDITVVEGNGEDIPGIASSFDAVVSCFVLCSVPDPTKTLAEMARVMKPGAQLRFYEHVTSENVVGSTAQRIADSSFWPVVAGGCYCSRDTAKAIEEAGFIFAELDRLTFLPKVLAAFPPAWFVAPRIIGRAVGN